MRKVFQAFRWSPTSVQPKTGVWEIVEGDRRYALKESSASREKLIVLHRMLEQVRTTGYPHLLPWIKAANGEVVVSAYGKQWYATPWQEATEETPPNAIDLATALGEFHRLSEPVAAQFPKLHKLIGQDEVEVWKERQTRVKEWQELSAEAQISTVSGSNLSDHGFTFAIKGLDKFFSTDKGVAPRYTLSHERIHPSNVLPSEEGFYWVDFDHAELNTPVRDLATLVHRFPEVSATEIISAYEKENKLLPKEKRLLLVYLAYPERLVRIVERNEDDVDFERELAHVEACQTLAKTLWPSKKKAKANVHSHQPRRKK